MRGSAISCRIRLTKNLYNPTLSRVSAQEIGPPQSPAVGLHLPPDMTASLHYEAFQILERVDSTKNYRLALDPTFPLAIGLFEFPSGPGAVPMTWHERLEIFCPLAGSGAFRVGDHVELFKATDILLVDNLRLHGVDRFDGACRRALVVVFYPDLVAPAGAFPCDMWLLRPFRHLVGGCLRLGPRDSHSAKAWDCLSRLVLAHVADIAGVLRQIRQKLALTELLIVLEEAFRDRVSEDTDYESRRGHLQRLTPLLDYIGANLDEPLAVPSAARMLNMSPSYFMRFFRTATGLTFSSYLLHLRVSRAYQLLNESDLSLAQIATETGFCDQCYMSRLVRRRFGESPGRIRSQARQSGFRLPPSRTG
jgi:AraC-like DNA-binding protein